MVQKDNFKKAYRKLAKEDAPILKEVITSRCKWGDPTLFYMKMRGDNPVLECNHKGIDEPQIIETTFRCFGIDAWTGERIII